MKVPRLSELYLISANLVNPFRNFSQVVIYLLYRDGQLVRTYLSQSSISERRPSNVHKSITSVGS